MAVSKENSNHHENLTSLLNCIDLLKENCASCVSEKEVENIFEPICSDLNLSSSKIYSFFSSKMKNVNLSKGINLEELNDLFTRKANITESCSQYENTVAWRPSGDVKKDLSIKYNAEKLKYKEKLEEENHKAKLELNKLIDEISYKRNRIDRMKTELPELDDSIDKIQSINYRAHELNKEKIKDIEI
ncbi:hypothetical protein M8J77_022462 [Diaphorina citri]|nr:hypothetical protein M8J77_022462 [Diaphorina citri]